MQPSQNPSSNQSQRPLDIKPIEVSQLSDETLKGKLEEMAGTIRRQAILAGRPVPLIEVIKQKEDYLIRATDPKTKFVVSIVVGPSVQRNHELNDEATRLYKAWLMAIAILGVEMVGKTPYFTKESLLLPTGQLLIDNQLLAARIKQLRNDFESIAKLLLVEWNPAHELSTSLWLAQKHDEWTLAGSNAHCIGRLHEVEEEIGRLSIQQHGDYPPYTQVVIQGYTGAGFRHPEYHLSSDLALLYNLFLDSWNLMDAAQALGKLHCSQNSQSLGRVVIITCFNLLESFVDGLAASFLHENPDAPERIKNRLNGKGTDGKYRKIEIKEKYERFIADITGGPNLDVNLPPFRDLFAKHKWRRNAFVHPSMPHHSRDDYRIKREVGFHDITLEGVSEAVDLTDEAICVTWRRVYGKARPSWLPKRESGGRFCRVDVELRPIDTRS